MVSEERREQLREAGRLGGRATVERHGAAHMSEIGKLGFAVTLARHGGETVTRLLSASYEAKYGKPPTPRRDPAADAERAATRRAYPTAEPCAKCGAPGQHRHHPDGWRAGHGVIVWLCGPCHRQEHEAMARLARANADARRRYEEGAARRQG